MIDIVKWLHILCALSLLGFAIGGYYYSIQAIKTQNNSLIKFTLLNGLIFDVVSFMMIPFIYISGTLLVRPYHFNFCTPWIRVAYIALTLVLFLWVSNFLIRLAHYNSLKYNHPITYRHNRLCHICAILIIMMLILIVRDAVTKSTWFY